MAGKKKVRSNGATLERDGKMDMTNRHNLHFQADYNANDLVRQFCIGGKLVVI